MSNKLTPGPHNLIIQNTFSGGFLSMPQGSDAEMHVDLKPGLNYQLKLGVDNVHTYNWLIDEQGASVTEKVKAPFKMKPGSME